MRIFLKMLILWILLVSASSCSTSSKPEKSEGILVVQTKSGVAGSHFYAAEVKKGSASVRAKVTHSYNGAGSQNHYDGDFSGIFFEVTGRKPNPSEDVRTIPELLDALTKADAILTEESREESDCKANSTLCFAKSIRFRFSANGTGGDG